MTNHTPSPALIFNNIILYKKNRTLFLNTEKDTWTFNTSSKKTIRMMKDTIFCIKAIHK